MRKLFNFFKIILDILSILNLAEVLFWLLLRTTMLCYHSWDSSRSVDDKKCPGLLLPIAGLPTTLLE